MNVFDAPVVRWREAHDGGAQPRRVHFDIARHTRDVVPDSRCDVLGDCIARTATPETAPAAEPAELSGRAADPPPMLEPSNATPLASSDDRPLFEPAEPTAAGGVAAHAACSDAARIVAGPPLAPNSDPIAVADELHASANELHASAPPDAVYAIAAEPPPLLPPPPPDAASRPDAPTDAQNETVDRELSAAASVGRKRVPADPTAAAEPRPRRGCVGKPVRRFGFP